MIAARLARSSAASSVLPSRETARSRGHDSRLLVSGGKLCTTGASPGAGTGIVSTSLAVPLTPS